MSGFVDDLLGSMGPEISRQLSSSLNIDPKQAAGLIPAVAPLILGGLKRQSENFGGQDRVDHILNKYGSPDVLGNLSDLFAQKKNDNTVDATLGGLLGDSGVQASNMLANQFNLDSSTASRIIPMLAPVILGFLTQKRDQGGMGSSGVSSLLDQNGDGSILDDVAGFLLKGVFGGSGGSSSSGGGLGGMLGGLLGGLLGGKKR
ncbi:MAG TPA: DUF937 domain-containing protein [Calditrichia bacterium]|nr:DUF937 domain-containing protein [Calditrichia bacterium]